MKSQKIILFVFLLSIFLGCNDLNDDSFHCTTEYVYGLNITLIDKETKAEITKDVKVTIQDGDYEEVLQGESSLFYGAGERAGTYIVTVTSDNYKTFISDPITVTEDACHVNSVSRTFELEPKT